jgi:hypothetical protein
MSASRLYDVRAYDQRGEPIERLQLFTGQIGKQQLLVHHPHRRFRIAAMHETPSVTAGNLRHDPLSDAGANLAIPRIKIAIVGYIDNLICPKIHEEKTRGAVAVAEPSTSRTAQPRTAPSLGISTLRQMARKLSPSVIRSQIISPRV